ncbi:hypothetical protein SDC9_195973 [bioreactor metagenome]|uniref:Uncharacterized protein n=1 Tax=bioreactor metagenome TaxID=1076179 RepID=A0A645IBR5_9ZZZZ
MLYHIPKFSDIAELIVKAPDFSHRVDPVELYCKYKLQKRRKEKRWQRYPDKRKNSHCVIGSAVLPACGENSERNGNDQLKEQGNKRKPE